MSQFITEIKEKDGFVVQYHHEMQCYVETLSYDYFERAGDLRMAEGSCADMNGCIRTFKRIDARVRLIRTFSGEYPDTFYKRSGANWEAVCQRKTWEDYPEKPKVNHG